ncbi:MAG: M23 family metallopeptidase [Actinomycetota bacterium]|nr:M23 family metallopeptidase [Actinomycetota bacterium]
MSAGVARVVLGVLLALLPPAAVPAADGAPPGPIDYRPPVDAPVVDGFRPPSGPYGPGNRGLEYATRPGTAVGAIGPGVVTFAGSVAGQLHVTVRHPDGLRSSYSFLATVDVAVDDRLERGGRVGSAGRRLHLGVRRGTTYLDPAALFGPRRARLVPVPGR